VARIARTSGAVLIAIVAAASGRGSSSLAQEGTSCAQIPTAAERLACYDRVSPPAEPGPATVGAPSAAPEGVAGDAVNGVEPAAAVPTDASESERAASVPVVVVGMRKYPGRSATFTTDDGDVWVQIGAEGVYLPKVPFKAELRPASMGTYFLRPAAYGWRVHVRRND
jgi:hypothetical protein